jgi:hypothetical protein
MKFLIMYNEVFSCAISLVSVTISTLMVVAQKVSETLDCNSIVTWRIAREDFIEFSRH